MRRPFFFLALAVSAVLLVGCPRDPQPPPHADADGGDYPVPPDYNVDEHPEDSPAGLSSPCGKACENLRRVGCREGFPTREGVSCYRGCLSMARHQRVPTVCWMTRRTPEEVRACGGLRCLPPL